ncbi:uncharacterized protein [Rhodnius prolixus]
MPGSQPILVFLIFSSLMYMACDGCDLDQVVRGCKIQQRQCICGIGCRSEYRYRSREECRNNLKGKVSDVCSTKPCANNGICMQTPMSPSMYKCRCEGTGYYGSRCEYPCPLPGSIVRSFPHECIVI